MTKTNAISVVFTMLLCLPFASCSINNKQVRVERPTMVSHHTHKMQEMEVRIALPAHEVTEEENSEIIEETTTPISGSNPDVNTVVYIEDVKPFVQKFQSFKNVEETAKNWKNTTDIWMSGNLSGLNIWKALPKVHLAPLKITAATKSVAINFNGLTSAPWPTAKLDQGFVALAILPARQFAQPIGLPSSDTVRFEIESKAQAEVLKAKKTKKGYILPPFPKDIAGWLSWLHSGDQNLQAAAVQYDETHNHVLTNPPKQVVLKKIQAPARSRRPIKWNVHFRVEWFGWAFAVLVLLAFIWLGRKVKRGKKKTLIIPALADKRTQVSKEEEEIQGGILEAEGIIRRREQLVQEELASLEAQKQKIKDDAEAEKTRLQKESRRKKIQKKITWPLRLLQWKFKKPRVLKKVRLIAAKKKMEQIKINPTLGIRKSRTVISDGRPMQADWETVTKPIGEVAEDNEVEVKTPFVVNHLPPVVFEKAHDFDGLRVLLENEKYYHCVLTSRKDSSQVVYSQDIGNRIQRIQSLVRESTTSKGRLSKSLRGQIYQKIKMGIETLPVSEVNSQTGKECLQEFVLKEVMKKLPDFEMEIPVADSPQGNQASA